MKLQLNACWSDDCMGQKDYDGNILAISTRYWPAGGGYLVVNRTPDSVTVESSNDGSPPEARSRLILRHKGGESIVLADSGDITGETFEEVKAKVEAWAQQQFDELVALLRQHYTFRNWDEESI